MKAAWFEKQGPACEMIVVGEMPDPIPAPGEVRIRTPMYNFAVPAALKAWVGHVVRAGKTFHYTAAGKPEGLLAGRDKKVLAIIASGANYAEGSGLTTLD